MVFSNQCAHADAFHLWVAYFGFCQLIAERFLNLIDEACRDKNAANSSALLATLHRHLFAHFLDEQIKFRSARNGVCAQNGGVQQDRPPC